MILTTTDKIDGREVREYIGIVGGEAIVGAHVFKDIMASLRDFFGGRSKAYEKTIREAKTLAFKDLEENARRVGAEAVIGIDIEYQVVGQKHSMLMVSINGTAVKFR